MNRLSTEEAVVVVMDCISDVAPDVEDELPGLSRDVDVFEALDLDSMDHVNVMTGVWERTGIEIPEREYGHLRTLDALARHLSS